MPKQFLKIDRFEGGWNNRDDPRDIAVNELTDLVNMTVEHIGRIVTMGEVATHSQVPSNACSLRPGYGLFTFSADYDFETSNSVTSVTNNGGKAQFNTSFAHGLSSGDVVFHSGFSESTYNGKKRGITVISSTAYTTDISYVSNDTGTLAKINACTNESTDYLLVCDSATAEIDVYSRKRDAWIQGMIDLGTTSNCEAVYYSVDGGLRVADRKLGTNNKPKWWGYIKRDHFGGDNSFDEWYEKDNNLASPTRGLFGISISDSTNSSGDTNDLYSSNANAFSGMSSEMADAASNSEWYYVIYYDPDTKGTEDTRVLTYVGANHIITSDLDISRSWGDSVGYKIFPYPGTGFCVDIGTLSGGDWIGGYYELAQTFVYDNTQESLPMKLTGDGQYVSVSDGDKLNITVHATTSGSINYDERISGGRIYIREYNPSYDKGGDWILLVDIDLNSGLRTSLISEYSAWTQISLDTSYGDNNYYLKTVTSFNPNLDTYESLNGYSQDEQSISIGGNGMGYRDAVVSNRRCFVVAPKMVDENGQTVYMGDRIAYTPPNRFDTFPSSFYMDIGINDGDEFVAVATFADRLLAFKKKKLYIINISQGTDIGWFIEAEHTHLGVYHKAAVFQTEYGVVWCNDRGVYFYDGQKIVNIAESKIAVNTIGNFIKTGTTSYSIIGFIPKTRQVLVLSKCDSTNAGNIYLYDIKTNSWMQGNSILDSGNIVTNFVIDWNNDLVWMYNSGTGGVHKWSHDSASYSGQYFATRDYDFGNPDVYKRIYAIYLTYKVDVDNTNVLKYAVDGSTTYNDFATMTLSSSTDWNTVKVTPTSPIDCLSFRLKFSSSTKCTVQINSLSIEYRILPVKRVS